MEPNTINIYLEANPNPSISEWDDFARAADKAGVAYPDLIDRLIALALENHRSKQHLKRAF